MAVQAPPRISWRADTVPTVAAPSRWWARAGARAAGIATSVVVAFALVGLVALAIGPRTGRYRVLTVQSGSMGPTLPVGSLIIVTPMPRSHVRAGDIITFQPPNAPGTLETHRVVKVLQHGAHPIVRTKGDANTNADPWRLRLLSEPAWKVRSVVPGLGSALAWMRSPLAHLIAVLGAPLLLGALWVSEIWNPGAGLTRRRRQPQPVGA